MVEAMLAFANGTLAGDKTVHYSIAGAGADTINPNAKLSYVREFVVGVDATFHPSLF